MCDENPIFRSFTMIEERIQEKLTIENLANSLHLSKYHYQRLFREAVGDSVMRYVTRRRMSLAAEELAEGDSAVLEIALKYGYDSHEGFTRSFRAYIGVTPTEYRKYHQSITSPATQKERCAMLYSKTTDEMLRELNALIVQARETAEYTRKNETAPLEGGGGFYVQYWENIADKADAMAEKLSGTLKRITAIAEQPDEISARFMVIKAIEDAAFWSSVIAFETGLTISRAEPAHRAAFMPLCGRYEQLAQNSRIKAGKIAEFFKELSAMIFQDMREKAQEQIGKIEEKSKAAVALLSADSDFPYAYITEEISAVTDELCAVALDKVTIQMLEDALFRIDIVALAADVDILRAPSRKELFSGISALKEQIGEALEFFRNLADDIALTKPRECSRPADKKYSDFGFQGKILLFYLKGEIQKLNSARLGADQQDAFRAACNKLNSTIQLAYHASDDTDAVKIRENLHTLHDDIIIQSENLGKYGEPIKYIGESIKQLADAVS